MKARVKEEKLIQTVLLRSLQKARNAAHADIHFGLASEDYCQFTSPIRRYADLFIHRIMHEDLKRKETFSWEGREEEIESIAQHISETEIEAEMTERDVEDLKKAEYMSEHIVEVFQGTVSSLNSFGFCSS